MASVHALVEDDTPCCGRRHVAAAPGAARDPCLLVLLWCAALHPWGVRAASVPLWGERSEGAAVRAGGGTQARVVAPSGLLGSHVVLLAWRAPGPLGTGVAGGLRHLPGSPGTQGWP